MSIDEIFMTHKIVTTEWGKKVMEIIDTDSSGGVSVGPSVFVCLFVARALASSPCVKPRGTLRHAALS